MAAERGLEYINRIRSYGVLETGQPSFLRGWEPVRFLGKGSYGFVYEIRRGRERCAVKIIDMGAHPDVDYSVEIRALTMLRGQKHAANIYEYAYVSINSGGFTDRYLLIRMNLLSDLPDSMSEDEVIDLGAQMCDILSVCHGGETKIYHCDIKPENILIAKDGSYILCDYGASSITQKTSRSSGHAGTPLFEAPEMLRFESFDGRSDIFSLGMTMYALLNNGLPPFARDSGDADAIRIRLEGRKTIPAIDGVSEELTRIIRRMCAYDADKRYGSAEELGAVLTGLLSEREAGRLAEEEAMRKEAEEAIRIAGEEEARRKAEEEARRRAGQERTGRRIPDDRSAADVFGSTAVRGGGKNIPGGQRAGAAAAKRRPAVIIAIAAALAAAIICGAIWLPKGKDANVPVPDSRQSETDARHFRFYEKDGGYVLLWYDDSEKEVVVPSSYNGKPIVRIGDSAFINDTVTSVIIPDTVTSIGFKAFNNCGSLAYIDMGSGVTVIGAEAFNNCGSLASVSVPAGVTSISDKVFYNCSRLSSVTVSDSVKTIGSHAFYGCKNLTVTAPHKPSYYGYKLDDGVKWNAKWINANSSSPASIAI